MKGISTMMQALLVVMMLLAPIIPLTPPKRAPKRKMPACTKSKVR